MLSVPACNKRGLHTERPVVAAAAAGAHASLLTSIHLDGPCRIPSRAAFFFFIHKVGIKAELGSHPAAAAAAFCR